MTDNNTMTLNTDAFEEIDESPHENPQTETMYRATENGQVIAVERGVTHGKPYTVTRFAAAIWETYEPLEYHGSFDRLDEAEQRARDVCRDIKTGELP